MSKTENLPLVVVVGPTGVGKTEVAIRLANDFDGEIVSADSRQIYRYMTVGTAKPTPYEQSSARHHLIEIVNPDEELTLALYQELAYRTIMSIGEHGHLPLLVGGTGQYIRAVVEGWEIPEVPPQRLLRADLESFAESYGAIPLHTKLAQLDPAAALSIDARNIRRVVRALEVCMVSKTPMTALQQRAAPPYQILIVGLTRDRQELYQRVDRRIDDMITAGLAAETQSLLEMGYTFRLGSMSTLGYTEMSAFLRGDLPLEAAVAGIKSGTRRYIRHQYNWFRPTDPKIQWFNLSSQEYEAIESAVQNWLNLLSSQAETSQS